MTVEVFDLSIVGRSKTICQDNTFSYSDGDLFVLAVADGLGSNRDSHLGSRQIIDFTVDKIESIKKLKEYDDYQDVSIKLNEIFADLIKSWQQWAKSTSLAVDTTYSLLVGYKDYYYLRSVGDSILIFANNENYDVIVAPETVRTRTGATPSLQHIGGDYYVANFYNSSITQLILSTDGLEDIVITDKVEKRARYVHAWFKELMKSSLVRDTARLSQTITTEFIAKCGETKGDDVGFAYAIFT